MRSIETYLCPVCCYPSLPGETASARSRYALLDLLAEASRLTVWLPGNRSKATLREDGMQLGSSDMPTQGRDPAICSTHTGTA